MIIVFYMLSYVAFTFLQDFKKISETIFKLIYRKGYVYDLDNY